MLLTVPIAPVSLAVRFRRARGLERQQLRWLAFAAGLASVGAVPVLAGGYAGIALGLGRLLGRESSLVVAAATLAVVALFQPVRGDSSAGRRRFNRRRSDTARIIATFSTRLRDQVDLTTLTGELLPVVNQAVQPTRTSLWLRPQGAAGATDGTAAHRFLSRR